MEHIKRYTYIVAKFFEENFRKKFHISIKK